MAILRSVAGISIASPVRARTSIAATARVRGAARVGSAVAVTLWDRQEISWTIWGPSVPHIGLRPIERNHRRSRSTSRISRLRSDPRWGAIGHAKVQVISCRSLCTQAEYRPAGGRGNVTDSLCLYEFTLCSESGEYSHRAVQSQERDV